jgi:hypothetical protein
MNKVEEACGPLDLMVMEDGRDAYKYWRKKPVRLRGDVVHGREDGTAEAAEYVLAYAEQMIKQLKYRLIVTRTHPVSDVFREAFSAARDVLGDPDASGS